MNYSVENTIPKKIAYFTFIILLAFMFVVGIPCSQAKAIAPLVIAGVAIAPEVVAAGISLLVASGLIFASQTDAMTAFKDMFLNASPTMRANLAFLKVGINVVTDDLWADVRSYVSSRFSANEINKSVPVIYGEHAFGSTVLPYSTDITKPYVISRNSFTLPINIAGKGYINESSNLVDISLSAGALLYPIYSGLYGSIQLRLFSNNIQYAFLSNSYVGYTGDTYWKTNNAVDFYVTRMEDGNYWLCWKTILYSGKAGFYKITKMCEATDPINYEAYAASSSGDLSPTLDYKNPDAIRNLLVPPIVAALINALPSSVRTYEPATTAANTGTNTGDITETSKNWWSDKLSNLFNPLVVGLGAIKLGMSDIWTWLQNFWKSFTDSLTGILNPVITGIQSMVNSIAGVQTAVNEGTGEPDLTQNYKNFNLPDLLLLLLLVIIAFIRLILRALIWIIELYGLIPSSDMLNPNIIEGIEFLKNQELPYFNTTFWSLVNILFAVLFGFSLITIGKKFILSLGGATGLGSLYQKNNNAKQRR